MHNQINVQSLRQIKIRALDIFGKPILKIADKILLDVENNRVITHTLSNPTEEGDGIYIFDDIPNDISPFANIFVRLDSNTFVPNTSNRYYCQNSYFLHKTCTQINKFQAMLDNTKPTPYVFHMQIRTNIGIIKAYKKDNGDKFIEVTKTQPNPYNEIYTIDIEQTIQLRAFVYENHKTYVAKNKKNIYAQNEIPTDNSLLQGNITKIIKDISNDKTQYIKWAFKIVDGSHKQDIQNEKKTFPSIGNKEYTINLTDKDSRPLNYIPKGYVEIEGKYGSTIELCLKDLFDDKLLGNNKDNTNDTKETLINKSIIFFAYDESGGIDTYNAYCAYKDNNKNGSLKKVYEDRITSIELKILKTRFRLEFDGQTLQFLENERVLGEWNARSGMAIENTEIQNDTENGKHQTINKDRLSIKHNATHSFYYDTDITQNHRPLKENANGKCYFVKFNIKDFTFINSLTNEHILKIYDDNKEISQINAESPKIFSNDNNTTNPNINLMGNHSINFFTTFYNTLIKNKNFYDDNISIPLNVQYQKRILITIERFKETSESTKARMNIFIDGKRVDAKGKFIEKNTSQSIKEYEMFNPFSLPNDKNNYAYILERNGPDCIGKNLKLRIPDGRYGVAEWYIESGNTTRDNTLKLTNFFVDKYRNILIHNGNTTKNTDGCLLINENDDGIDNVLSCSQSIKKTFYYALQHNNGSIKKYFNGINKYEIIKHIEIRIRNVFENKQ